MRLSFCHGISDLQRLSSEVCFGSASAEQCCDHDRTRAAAGDDRAEQEAHTSSGDERGADTMTLDDVVGTHLVFGAFQLCR